MKFSDGQPLTRFPEGDIRYDAVRLATPADFSWTAVDYCVMDTDKLPRSMPKEVHTHPELQARAQSVLQAMGIVAECIAHDDWQYVDEWLIVMADGRKYYSEAP